MQIKENIDFYLHLKVAFSAKFTLPVFSDSSISGPSINVPEIRKVHPPFARSNFQIVCAKTHTFENQPFVTSQRGKRILY